MIQQRIESDFVYLGKRLIELSKEPNNPYKKTIETATLENGWFTKPFINLALKNIGESLATDKINSWLSRYQFEPNSFPKQIGLILAGNIPLVGFHDMLCVLLSGNRAIIKLSIKDQLLYSIIKDILVTQNPDYSDKLIFTDGLLNNVDAVIATGSDNSARYFEYYFGKYPNIIRKNRNSIAIISGTETPTELEKLADDIFTYFGMGCRNVSFLWLPEKYPIHNLFQSFSNHSELINNTKYANNYDYQKAIMLMNKVPFFDNGLVMLRESNQLSSPIGVIHFQHYESESEISDFIMHHKHKIQCVVSKTKFDFHTYELGTAQKPELWDYADNVDTMDFLTTLK